MPSSGTTVRSWPSMPPTRALTATRRTNWPGSHAARVAAAGRCLAGSDPALAPLRVSRPCSGCAGSCQVPGAVAAQDVGDVGEALGAEQARRRRGCASRRRSRAPPAGRGRARSRVAASSASGMCTRPGDHPGSTSPALRMSTTCTSARAPARRRSGRGEPAGRVDVVLVRRGSRPPGPARYPTTWSKPIRANRVATSCSGASGAMTTTSRVGREHHARRSRPSARRRAR